MTVFLDLPFFVLVLRLFLLLVNVFCLFLLLLLKVTLLRNLVMYKKYRVRVLFSYPISDELIVEFDSWNEAIKVFQFYVSVCLTFPKETSVRCVNIFKAGRQKSIRLFQNY